MRIAICDDNAQCRQELTDLVREYADMHPHYNLTISVFKTAQSLLDDIAATGSYDVCLLDVVMPEVGGIELGRRLRESGDKCHIVYLSFTGDFALDAFRVKALDYVVKPISRCNLFPVLDEIVHRTISAEKNIMVKTRDSLVRLTYDSIVYAQLTKRAIVYHCADGSSVESTSIRTPFAEAIAPLQADSRFVLCGASTLVNLHHISAIENGMVKFRNGTNLFLSVKAYRMLRSIRRDYWTERLNEL